MSQLMKELLSTVADGYDSVRPGAGDCVRQMAEEKYPGEGCVPCELCNKPTPMTGSKRCDRCWELERRIQADPAIARKIISGLEEPEPRISHSERLQHLANLCERHKRDLLPAPTVIECVDCAAELEKRRINDPD